MNIEEVKNISIIDYLSKRGLEFEDRGAVSVCSSPFSSDSDPSFAVYGNNSFYDFSTDVGGDIITLVQKLYQLDNGYTCTFTKAVEHLSNGDYETLPPKQVRYKRPPFNVDRFITRHPEHIAQIEEYAKSRNISSGFLYSIVDLFVDDYGFMKHLAMGFPHYNGTLTDIIGVKFRFIDPTNDRRFSSRGRRGFYILENLLDSFDDPVLYLVESETSANSLWSHLRGAGKSCVVISCGSVNAVPKMLPDRYKDIDDKRLIIDYDGSEEKFQERIKKYEHLGMKVVKIPLPKGEDINSLHVENKLYTINNLIL